MNVCRRYVRWWIKENLNRFFFVGGNETLICGKHSILFCLYCQATLYIIKKKVIDTTQLNDNNHSVVLLNYQPIMCTKHCNKVIDDVSIGYHWRTRKYIIKQQVICIHAIILLYFEKRLQMSFSKYIKKVRKQSLWVRRNLRKHYVYYTQLSVGEE